MYILNLKILIAKKNANHHLSFPQVIITDHQNNYNKEKSERLLPKCDTQIHNEQMLLGKWH